MVKIDEELYAAVEVIGADMVIDIARAVVRAHGLHPVFAHDRVAGARVVDEEVTELFRAAQSESMIRQRAEAVDVIVTALRYIAEFCVTQPAPASEEYFRPAEQVWGDDVSRGVSEPHLHTKSENVLREDPVHHPPHYTAYPVEVIDMIKLVLGPDGFKAYCLGNEVKYRMRAGLKGDADEDIAKAMKYKEFRDAAV